MNSLWAQKQLRNQPSFSPLCLMSEASFTLKIKMLYLSSPCHLLCKTLSYQDYSHCYRSSENSRMVFRLKLH